MKIFGMLSIILLVVGGLNWGLVGLFNFDLVATVLGAGSMLARVVYVLVGVCAIYQIVSLATKQESGHLQRVGA
jgi:uncharacterized membrane protein YuzA (DUF378 family)